MMNVVNLVEWRMLVSVEIVELDLSLWLGVNIVGVLWQVGPDGRRPLYVEVDERHARQLGGPPLKPR